MTYLSEYLSHLKKTQKFICYIIGENKEQVASAVFVEHVQKQDFEVVYVTEPINEYCMQRLKEYDRKRLVW